MARIQFADVLEHELDNLRGAAFLLQDFAEARDGDDECRCALGLLADSLFSTADTLAHAHADLERTLTATTTKEG